ncbi:MAG TPA: hypothetical protein PKE47_00510 [Verrucomicrobiota bacterium]|nr:hypothetical protein [Verrucomicrobiota bacterium]
MKCTESDFLAEIFTAPQGEAGPHLTNEQLDACASCTLADTERKLVERHLDHCAECAELVLRLLEADAASDEPLPFPISVPDFDAIRARHQRASRPASFELLALAASEKEALPEIVFIEGLLPGFYGEATGDGCAPSAASTLRLELTAPESPQPEAVPPEGVLAVWPTGQTMPVRFTYCDGHWWAKITLPLAWPEVVGLLAESKIQLVPLPVTK